LIHVKARRGKLVKAVAGGVHPRPQEEEMQRSGGEPVSVSFRVEPLAGDQVALALPLVQVTWPLADMGGWREFVNFFSGQGTEGGILALRDPADYLCGILVFRVLQDVELGRILEVPLFTTVDMANSLRVVRALLDAAENRAYELGCAGLQIRLQREQAGLSGRLRRLGLISEVEVMSMPIDAPQKSN
jgi:hypothetical protein